MRKNSATIELATRISRALISASVETKPQRSWTPSLEQTLHRLSCRDTLNPSLVAGVIDPFLLNHHSIALGFFNWASQQPGFSHNSISFKSILKSLSISRQFNAIDSILKQVRTQKVALDSSVYRSVIASQIIGKKTQNAFLTFSQINTSSEEIGAETCNSLLAALSSDGYFDSAQKVFREMTHRCVPFSTLGFGVFIWRVCRKWEIDMLSSVVDEVKGGDSEVNGSVIAVLIIHGLCQASRASEAFLMLDNLRNRGWKPDFMAYRIVAEAFRSVGNVADRETVLKKKRKLGVAPRVGDYREFIFGLVSERRISEAKELGEIIVSGNFPIDDDVLNVLIGSVSAIDPASAMTFFNFMAGKERFPTLLTLTNLSRNLCRSGNVGELLEVFVVLNSNDYFKDLEGYSVIISFLCKAGRVKEAYGVLLEMRKKGLRPHVSSYNYLMEACCKKDLLRPAKKLWDEMFAGGCDGNLDTYNILINKFSEVGQIEEAERLFNHMLEKGAAPDSTTYVLILEGLCRKNKLEAAFDIYNKFIEQDIILSRAVLSRFVLSLCKEGHFRAASKLLRSLNFSVGYSEPHMTLLKFIVDARELPIAIEHLKWVKERSPSRLQDITTELLASLSSYPELRFQVHQALRDIYFVENKI